MFFVTMKKSDLFKPRNLLIALLLLTAVLRLNNIWYPSGYVFDEVYHAFTAKEYVLNHKEAWEYWTTPPPNVAYEWTHPPFAKEVMAISMYLFNTTDAWAYRLPNTLMGVLSVFLVYLIGKRLFKKEVIALISALIFSLDGLNFVQSRTGMNDIYFVTLMLGSFYFFLKKRFIISAIILGLSLASKWTAVYTIGIYFVLLLILDRKEKEYFSLKNLSKILYFLVIPPLIYLISYIPFFLQGHSLTQFKELQQQMWWYHTGLKATHDYTSPWWSWPLNLYPVWYFVDYHDNGKISNIFASGNPMVFWMGTGAVIISVWEFIKTRNKALLIALFGFFGFFIPWALSPRIMFLYHYTPSVPFLSLLLGYQIGQLSEEKSYRTTLILTIALIILGFIFIYPMLIGIPLPKNLMELFFNTNITKNPFG